MLNSLGPTEHERASRLAALGVSAVGIAVCAWLLVRLLWLLLPRSEEAAPVPASAPPPPPAVSVAKWHLFGNPQALPGTSALPALATVLKLGLRGTLALPDPRDERALAIIANEQGLETSYRIGADVAPGAKLAEVYADHVVLDHQGAAETLNLPRPEEHAPALPARNQQNLAAAAAPSSLPPGTIPATPSSTSSSTSRSAPPKLDAADLARQIRLVPSADGRSLNADISGADPALLARVGLKRTDVVTAINGTPLAALANPQALADQLQKSSSIQVAVLRDGKPATLTLSWH